MNKDEYERGSIIKLEREVDIQDLRLQIMNAGKFYRLFPPASN
jgi:hypothetical protein